MPSTSNSFVISLTERGISLSIASSMTQGGNDLPLNSLSIFSQINEEIPIRNNFRFIRFSFDSRKTKTLNIIYKDNIITSPFSRDLLQTEDLLVVTGDRNI